MSDLVPPIGVERQSVGRAGQAGSAPGQWDKCTWGCRGETLSHLVRSGGLLGGLGGGGRKLGEGLGVVWESVH